MFKKTLYILIPLLLWTPSALAASAVFTTYPSHTIGGNKWIVRDVNPGQKYQEEITVENLQDFPISLSLQVVESAGDKKNIRLLENQAFQNIGNWIKPENNLIELAAHQKKSVKIDISVPQNTKLGEYQAAVLATNTNRNNDSLNIATRIGNRIYLNVTNASVLQANTLNLTPSINQILALVLAIGAIAYGLKPIKKLANQKTS